MVDSDGVGRLTLNGTRGVAWRSVFMLERVRLAIWIHVDVREIGEAGGRSVQWSVNISSPVEVEFCYLIENCCFVVVVPTHTRDNPCIGRQR